MFWIGAISFIMFVGSLGVVWSIIVLLPQDYLVSEHSVIRRRLAGHPVLRATLVVAKNILGLLLIAAGLVMLITPGQGVLFLLIGVSMLDMPGKQHAINRILSKYHVIQPINRIRARAHRPPLEIPPIHHR